MKNKILKSSLSILTAFVLVSLLIGFGWIPSQAAKNNENSSLDPGRQVIHVDRQNRWVGINTVPSTELSVEGTTLISEDLHVDGIIYGDGSGITGITTDPGGTDGQIQYNDNGIFNGASGLYYDDVNNRVGIGTDGPTGDLTIGLSGAAPGHTINFTNLGTVTGIIESTQYIGLRSGANSDIVFYPASTEAMRIRAAGNVGIGDNDADAHLEVSANGGSGGNIFLLSSNDNNDGDMLTVTESGYVGIGTTTPSHKLSVNGDTSITGDLHVDGTIYGTVSGGTSAPGGADGEIQYNDNGTLEGASGLYYDDVNGNVGIGTTDPGTALLNVGGDTDVRVYFGRAAIGTRNEGGASDYAYFSHYDHHSGSNYGLRFAANGDTALNSSTLVGFNIGNVSKMSLTSTVFNVSAVAMGIKNANPTGLLEVGNGIMTVLTDGNVGIGTTDPLGTLTVGDFTTAANVVFNSPNTLADGSAVQFRETDGSSWAGFQIQHDTLNNMIDFERYISGAKAFDIMTFSLGNGNVGIGTTTPSHKLSVNGDTSVSNDLYVGGKIYATGGVDPSYVLYDPMTREEIKEMAKEISEDKKGGAMMFFNGETKQFEYYLPVEDRFESLSK